MDKLENNVVLNFHPDTLTAVRKEFNLENPGNLEESINILDKWVAVQTHFVKKDFSREYLERTLISSKGSIERAKLRLDKSCTVKSLLPQYFEMSDAASDIIDYDNTMLCALLPLLTKNHERIFILKVLDYSGSTGFIGVYKYFVKVFEYINKNDYNTAVRIILDYSNQNIKNLLAHLHVMEVRQIMNILMEGYGLRLKKLYILSTSKMIDSVVGILKQVMTSKLAKRIQVIQTYHKLHEDLQIEILPEEYGGKQKSIKDLHENLFKALSEESFVDHLKEMQSAITNEDLRSSIVFNETYLGVPGSFKKIAFD